MILGTDVIPQYAVDSGFEIVDSVKILGINITKNFWDLYKNFDKIELKLSNIAGFWNRFKLSLIGRINIAKTLMLSQIGYFGSILSPAAEQLKRMSVTITNFVTGGFRISKDDLFLHNGKGGLGLIDLEEFLCGLQSTWIKKCIGSNIDNWRFDINLDTFNNPVNFSQFGKLATETQLYSNWSSGWESIKVCFYQLNDNFLISNLYGNPLLVNNRHAKLRFDLSIVPPPDTGNWNNRTKLKINDFLSVDFRFKSKPEIDFILDIVLNIETYNLLKIAVSDSIHLFHKKRVVIPGPPQQDIETFLKRFKKG
jgi:hypothetical protein